MTLRCAAFSALTLGTVLIISVACILSACCRDDDLAAASEFEISLGFKRPAQVRMKAASRSVDYWSQAGDLHGCLRCSWLVPVAADSGDALSAMP